MNMKKCLQFVLFAALIIVLVIDSTYARSGGGGRTSSFRGSTSGSSFRGRSSSGFSSRVCPRGTFKNDFGSVGSGSPKHVRFTSPKHVRFGSPKREGASLGFRSGSFSHRFNDHKGFGNTSFRHDHNRSFQCHNRRFGHHGFSHRHHGHHGFFYFSAPFYPYYYPYYRYYYPYSYPYDRYTDTYRDTADTYQKEKQVEDTTPADETFDDEVIRHLDSISQAFADADYEQALKYAEQAVLEKTDNSLLRFVHSQTLFAVGKYTNAATVLRRALQTAAAQKQDVAYAIDLYPDEDILNGQIDALKKAVSSEPQRADLRLLLGYQLFGVGSYEQALESLRQAESDKANQQAARVLIDILEKSNEPVPSEAEGPVPEPEEKTQPPEQDY